MEVGSVLEELGLSEGEIKAYLALLKLGSSPVSKIKEETQLHRTTVYDFLEKLINKGFVGYVMKEGIKHYSASEPIRLMEFVKRKEDMLKQIMPELQKLSDFNKQEVTVEVYKGKEGFRSSLNKILSVGKDMYGFGFEEEKYEEMDSIMMNQYFRKCMEKGIKEHVFVKRSTKFLYPHKHIRYYFLPDDFFNPNPTMTFGEYVVIQNWEPFITILIKSKHLADSYKKYFDFLKSQTSMIFRGWDEVSKIFEDMLEDMKPGEEIMAYGVPLLSEKEEIYTDYYKKHCQRTVEKKVRPRIIMDERAKKNIKICKKHNWNVKTHPIEQNTPMEVDIYGSKSFMVIWKEDPKDIMAIVFEDKDITESFKKYGEMLWGMAKPA